MSITVLIVDDQLESRRLTVKLLQGEFRCLEAGDGRQALEILQREEVSLVLSDILMPDLDGFQLSAQITRTMGARRPKVVFYSSTHDAPGSVDLARRVGADGFLSRPLAADRLLSEVRRFLAEPSPMRATPLDAPAQPTRAYSEYLVRSLETRATALKESEERYRFVFEASPDALFLLDARTWRIEASNERAAELFATAGPLEGRDLRSLGKAQPPPVGPCDVEFDRGDGRAFLGELRWRAFDWRGEEKLLAAVRDVTEERRLRDELLQSEKLAAVGLLIGGVAHELNNPLTAILGLAQLAAQDADAASQLGEDLKVIEREALRCRRLIQSLLSFTRKHEHRLVETDLSALASEILDLKAYDLRRSGVTLEKALGKDLPPVVGDPYQLQQVLLNFLNNAEHATAPTKGRVTVRTFADGGEVLLEVADTGHGIPAKDLERIFEAFFTTKEPGKGTGLGLSICRKIVESHGGRLEVESESGKGTTFRVRLKAACVVGAAAAAAPAAGRTLIVDDDPQVLQFVSRALGRLGWRVVACSNSTEALERLRQESFDLVLADLEMPGADGAKLYEEAVRVRPELRRRFLVLTGRPGSVAAEPRLGGVPVLAKPFDLAEFEQVLQRLAPGLARPKAAA